MSGDRRTCVAATTVVDVPADPPVVVDYRPGVVFAALYLEERFVDGAYQAHVYGPMITKTGRLHSRQTGSRTYRSHEELPTDLEYLALGERGLRQLLRDAADHHEQEQQP